jgi:hypothetical protein
VYGKFQAGSRADTQRQREKKKKKKKKKKKLVVLPKLGCLASYIGYVPRVSTYLC